MSAAAKRKELPEEIIVKVAETVLEISGRQVRRLYQKKKIAGRYVGRVLLLQSASVLDYKHNRRPAGRPLNTGLSTEPTDDPAKREYNRIKQRERRARLRKGTAKGKGKSRRAGA